MSSNTGLPLRLVERFRWQQDLSQWSHALPLLVIMPLFVGFAWYITQTRFQPLEGSISLVEGSFFVDQQKKCPTSIPDDLGERDIIENSLTELLQLCVKGSLAQTTQAGLRVQLPHEWRSDLDQFADKNHGHAVYRFAQKLSNPSETDLWALVVPSASNNMAIFVNDRLLGRGGSFELPVARNKARPLLFSIPGEIFRPGMNYFDVYVTANPLSQGFLDKIYIGPAELLEESYQDFYFFRYVLPQTIALALLLISLLIATLWFYRRSEAEYGLFALACGLWALHTADQFVNIPLPLPAHTWDALMGMSLLGLGIVGILFIQGFLDKRSSDIDRSYNKYLIRAYLLLGAVLLLIPPAWLYPSLRVIVQPLALACGLYILFLVLQAAWKRPGRDVYALALAMGVIVIFGLYDFATALKLRPQAAGQLLHFGAPFLLFSFSWILLRRFVGSLQAAEIYNQKLLTLNQELEHRVEARGKKIAESFETIRQLEQKQVVVDERSRIMRDMHDGIGVYLTTMLRQLDQESFDRENLKASAHNALNDLRLMIDSLGNASSDLSAMLGMFRTRIAVLLNACDVELEWHVEELPPIEDFGPERALNLLRILQEAVTNALKHSGADCIHLSAFYEPSSSDKPQVSIQIRDNGCGLNETGCAGNGLKNMQYRANRIMADLHIESDGNGTTITVLLSTQAGFKPDNNKR